MSDEEWRPIAGWEGYYEVSDHGRVRSLERFIQAGPRMRVQRERILSPCLTRGGYPQVNLFRDCRGKPRKVHHLVLEAFVGSRPEGMEGCHNDGDPLNARLDNLRWDTPSNNGRDKRRHGTDPGLNKTACPYRHPLVAPNLVESGLPHRRCKACSRARANINEARRKGRPVPDRQELSDAHAARIFSLVAS